MNSRATACVVGAYGVTSGHTIPSKNPCSASARLWCVRAEEAQFASAEQLPLYLFSGFEADGGGQRHWDIHIGSRLLALGANSLDFDWIMDWRFHIIAYRLVLVRRGSNPSRWRQYEFAGAESPEDAV